MLVKVGDGTCPEVPAEAEAIEDLLFHDYYTRTPRIRLTGDAPDRSEPVAEVTLDANDLGRLVACAVRHPSLNMRQVVMAAIWNHPDSFRWIFRFGLEASEAFAEIRKIVAEELEKCSAVGDAAKPAGEALLPRVPLPPHLRDRERIK